MRISRTEKAYTTINDNSRKRCFDEVPNAHAGGHSMKDEENSNMQIKRKRQSSRWELSVTKELMYSHKLVQEFRSQERFTNPHYADLWTSQSSISIQAVMFHSQQQHVSEYSNDTRTQLRLPSTRRVVCQGSRVVTWQSVTALEWAVQFHAPFHRGKFSFTIKTEKIRKSRKSFEHYNH